MATENLAPQIISRVMGEIRDLCRSTHYIYQYDYKL
jgi:hypothetical protein